MNTFAWQLPMFQKPDGLLGMDQLPRTLLPETTTQSFVYLGLA